MKPLLDGKVAIITSAARGIGAATAALFSQHGAKIVINDLDPEPLEATAAEINGSGGEAKAVPGDVTDPDLPQALLSTADETWGAVDILVNNAGYSWDGTLHKMSDEQWHAMLDVHLNAVFRMIRAASPILCVPVVHAVTNAMLGPLRPYMIDRLPDIMFMILPGTKNGEILRGPPFR